LQRQPPTASFFLPRRRKVVAKGIGGVSSSGLLPQVDMFDMPLAINAVFDAFAYFHCFVFAVKHHSHSFQAVPVQKKIKGGMHK